MATEAQVRQRPDWLAAEMPPGYRNRLEEIQRLTRELEEIGRFGRLLWAVGEELAAGVRDAIAALEFDPGPSPDGDGSVIAVSLDPARRLLFRASATGEVIQRRSEDLARVFHMVQQVAGHGDRVVLVANHNPSQRPADRPDGIDAEALTLLDRLGVIYLPASTLFAVWSLSLQDRPRARGTFDHLHAQDGGMFLLPAPIGA